MTMELWRLSGGNPRIAQGNVTVGAGAQNTTMVSVAAGKKIIPVWFFLWGLGANTTQVKFTLRGVDTLDANRTTCCIDNATMYVQYMQPIFAQFGMQERNSFASGEDLILATEEVGGDSNTTGDVYKYTVGYYLVDA